MEMALSSLEQRHEDGRQEGIQETNRNFAKRMLRDGHDVKIVSKYTDLSEAQIQNLKDES